MPVIDFTHRLNKKRRRDFVDAELRRLEALDWCSVLDAHAQFLLAARQIKRAEDVLRRAVRMKLKEARTTLRIGPVDRTLYWPFPEKTLMDHYLSRRRIDKALALLERVHDEMASRATDGAAAAWIVEWVDYGRTWERAGDLEGAARILEAALVHDQSYNLLYKRLALVYERLGRYGDAAQVCRQALTRNLGNITQSAFEDRLRRLEKKQGTFPLDSLGSDSLY